MYKKIFLVLAFLCVGVLQAQEEQSADSTFEKFFSDTTNNHMSELLREVNLSYNVNRFTTTRSVNVSRMPLKNIENSQSYTVVTQSLMKDQLITSYADLFKNVPEVGVVSMSSNGRTGVSTRGFKVKSFIVDGMASYTKTNIDPANIERVEVVRGPSGSLYGNALTSYGGFINIVTKKPYNRFGGNISYLGGQFGRHRITYDINTPLSHNGRALFRLNGSLFQEDSYLDAGFDKSAFISPSFSYRVNSHLNLSVEMDYYHDRRTSPFHFIPYKNTSITDVRALYKEFDRKKTFNPDQLHFHSDQLNLRSTLKARINDNWSSTTGFSFSYTHERGYRMGLVGTSDSTLVRDVRTGPKMYRALNFRQDFLYDVTFNRGLFRNRLLFGGDYFYYSDLEQKRDAKVGEINFIHPGIDYYSFNQAYADQYFSSIPDTKFTKAHQSTYGAYISDVFSIDDHLHFSAALRLDHFVNHGTDKVLKQERADKFNQTTFSPKFGIVYEAIPGELSFYTNYMNGFSNVNGTDFEGKSFDPEEANQVEAGVKLSLLNGRLVSRASLYDIHVKNVVRDDIDHLDEKIQDGTQMSRGAEFEFIANPVEGLDIIFGYAYNYSKYLRADQGLEGTRPDGAGPKNTANLWLSYNFPKGIFKGLKFGIGGRYGSSMNTIKKFSGDFYVPEYKVLDASVSYTHSFYTINFKLNNLNNNAYYNNRLLWQEPRSFLVGLSFNLEKLVRNF